MVHICFTGGGSAGHVTPNIALIESAQQLGWQSSYIGSYDGVEKSLIGDLSIPYFAISTGKLRRQFSLKNCLTPFQVLLGIIQAYRHLGKIKPKCVFSKGGFVAFPVVFAAWCRGIPVIIHESDLTPGLANRLSFPFASKVCVTFPKGKKYFGDKNHVFISGTPIRKQLLQGDRQAGLSWCGFRDDKPVILVMGGGQGAQSINQVIQQSLDSLLSTFQIIHLCGPGKVNPELNNRAGYKQVEYLREPLADVLACADLIISRAGANTLYEILLLKKAHILIPLPTKASRGDQIDNAKHFQALGLSVVLFEEEMTVATLQEKIHQVLTTQSNIQQKLQTANIPNGTEAILQTIKQMVQA